MAVGPPEQARVRPQPGFPRSLWAAEASQKGIPATEPGQPEVIKRKEVRSKQSRTRFSPTLRCRAWRWVGWEPTVNGPSWPRDSRAKRAGFEDRALRRTA